MQNNNNENSAKRNPLYIIIAIVAVIITVAIIIAVLLSSQSNKEEAAQLSSANEATIEQQTTIPESTTKLTTVDTKTEATEEENTIEAESEVTEEGLTVESETEVAEQETIVEPVVYDGIDMESTLRGTEWMFSFYGIIDEPKLFVFNDTTNKKLILENGQEVEFSRVGDCLGIYLPEGATIKEIDVNNIFDGNTFVNGADIIRKYVGRKYDNTSRVVSENIVEYNGEEITLTATLILQD